MGGKAALNLPFRLLVVYSFTCSGARIVSTVTLCRSLAISESFFFRFFFLSPYLYVFMSLSLHPRSLHSQKRARACTLYLSLYYGVCPSVTFSCDHLVTAKRALIRCLTLSFMSSHAYTRTHTHTHTPYAHTHTHTLARILPKGPKQKRGRSLDRDCLKTL